MTRPVASTGRQPTGARRPGWVLLLERVLWNAPRLTGARCVGQHHLFDGSDGEHGPRTKAAIELCSRCPALTPCRTWYRSMTSVSRPRGVIAGKWRGDRRIRTRP